MATMTISFSDWTGGKVAPLEVAVPVLVHEVEPSKQLLATLDGHSDWVMSVAFSPDGATLAAGCNDGSVILWDVATGKQKRVLQRARRPSATGWLGGVRSLSFSPDGSMLAAGWFDVRAVPKSDIVEQFIGDVRLWDLNSGDDPETLKGKRGGAVTSLTFLPDSRTLVGVEIWLKEPGGGRTRQVRLWDISTGHVRALFEGDGKPSINGLAVAPDGKSIAIKRGSSATIIRDSVTGDALATLRDEELDVIKLFFSADGKAMFSADKRGGIKRWDIRTGRMTHVVAEESEFRSASLVFGLDASRLAMVKAGSSPAHAPGEILVARINKLKSPTTLKGHTAPISALAFSPDETTLASAGRDRSVRLWSIGR
ncbi:MAG: WD40 repeat domain-containing protein [Planctomycetes bacterium]|nr:WD40 repeat domain-containing protein [Planctomycetota bacterium]